MKLFAAFQIATVVLAETDGIVDDDVCVFGGVEVDCETKEPLIPALARAGTRALPDGDRRYADLKAIHKKMWKVNGLNGKDKFDERQLWAYGCHCHLLGDRPLSEMGRGAPKDALDNKCKAYKDCQKCVREKHGDTCIGEFVEYTWKFSSKNKQFESQDNESSCSRELFECDVQFAKDSFNQLRVFDEQYHFFYGGFDNRDPENCVSTPGIPVEHQCCGGHNKPYHWIGLNKSQCCPDSAGLSGYVADADATCE